jgi:hypothetical protein
LNTRQWKSTGNITQHLNLNISDGDGEKIRTCEAKSKVGTLRRAGKLGEVKCFTRKSTETPRPDRKPGEKTDFSARIH